MIMSQCGSSSRSFSGLSFIAVSRIFLAGRCACHDVVLVGLPDLPMGPHWLGVGRRSQVANCGIALKIGILIGLLI